MLDKIRKIEDPIDPRWVAADICALLDIDTSLAVTGQKRRPGSGLSKQERFKDKIETPGGIQTLLTINRDGVKRLLARSRKPNARTLARLFGIEVVLSCKETESFSVLAATFKHLAPKRQFCFDKYRIDFYLPSHRIAIECDEYGHSDRCKEYELIREQFLKESLNCTFIRFNPDEDDFNIGNVINQVLLQIQVCP